MATVAHSPAVTFSAQPTPVTISAFSSNPVDFTALANLGAISHSPAVTFTAQAQQQWLYQRSGSTLVPRRLARVIGGVLTFLAPPLPGSTPVTTTLAVARPTLDASTSGSDHVLYYYFVNPDGSWIRKTALSDLGIVGPGASGLSGNLSGTGTIAGCLSADLKDPTKHHSGRIIQLDRTQAIQKRVLSKTNNPPDNAHPGYILINGWKDVIWSGGQIAKENLDLNGGVMPDQRTQPKIGFDDHQCCLRATQNSGHVYLEGLKLGGSWNFETLDIGGQFTTATYTIINCYFDRTRRFVTGAPSYQNSHAYNAGDPVTNPNGKIVRALATFTSGTSYDPTQWSAELAGANHDGGDMIQTLDGAKAVNIIGCHFEKSDYQTIFLKATDASYRKSLPTPIPGTIDTVVIANCTSTYAYPDVETNGTGFGGHNDTSATAYREPLWISGASSVTITDYVVHVGSAAAGSRMNYTNVDGSIDWVRIYQPGATVVGDTGTAAHQTTTTVGNGVLVSTDTVALGSAFVTGGVLFLNDGIAAPQRATDAGLGYDPSAYT